MAPEWQVELQGAAMDLEELPDWLAGPELRVEARDGHYFLEGSDLGRFSDAGDVHRFAAEIVDRINAIGPLLWGDYEPVRTGAIVSEGGRQHIVTVFATGRARVKGKAAVLRVGDKPLRPKLPLNVDHVIRLASADSLVDRVFMYLRPPEVSWADLYRALEAIEEETGDVSKRGWAPEGERRLFHHTANNLGAIGIEARHGHTKHVPPAHPMSLQKARSLVSSVVLKWLQTK